MKILSREGRDPFYDAVPPGGEYIVGSGEVFVSTDGSTFTGAEARTSADEDRIQKAHRLGLRVLKGAPAGNIATYGSGGPLALPETQTLLE